MQTIINILERYRVPIRRHGEHHHATRNWIQTDCPSCSPGVSKFRLGWEINTGRVSCWQCGKRDAVQMLSQLCSIRLAEAIEEWQTVWKFSRPPTQDTDNRKELVNPIGIGPLAEVHKRYLWGRRLSVGRVVNTWDLQGLSVHHKLPWRVFIPIHDKFGRQVSWTTRAINDEVKRKYVTASPEEELVSHKSILYGAHHALHTVVVVEGPIDAWMVGPGAVATFGLAYTQQQVDLIAQYPIRAVCFDMEPDAQRKADKLCCELSAYPGITHRITLDTGGDPASAHWREIRSIREQFFGDSAPD